MRVLSIVALVAATAAAAPLAVRQAVVGQSEAELKAVNGPTALDSPNINNGSQTEGSLDSTLSMENAAIINPTDNTLTQVNENTDFHDNIMTNPTFNAAIGTNGGAVVGSDNEIYPGWSGRAGHAVLKRQEPVEVSNVNAPAAVNDPTVNNGALREGSLDADLSFDGADITNPVGNSLAQVNDNTEISDNNLIDPNWNQISDNNGPAMAGNGNVFIPINNEGMVVNLTPEFLLAQQQHQDALIGHYIHPHGF
ncbi:hypothetical protein IWQ56_001014 [Coemansia nantahalensis]|uniref:Uncharacterized protein n=1 Tax=Coemansia nantahalensis TaxID=2789366 RepID=A0ACC1JUF0_9FUNG|nr:hypothetical protein IWQ57_003995 [Coemansia nantahalensis]KAJ2773375.1 hypothetical protein IWQ56_001014 [Coemansia nantahalensis]